MYMRHIYLDGIIKGAIITLAAILALAILASVATYVGRKLRQRYVQKVASPYLDRMREANKHYVELFGPDIKGWNNRAKHISLNSKKQFDTYDALMGISAYLEEHADQMPDVPKETWNDYGEECLSIASSIPQTKTPWYLFWNDEAARKSAEEAVSAASLVHITWGWSYTSPAGRNHYEESLSFGPKDIYKVLVANERRHAWQASREYQRSLMTPGLRFDILKRDGYRCQICGRTAAEGATLEVDHKVPVAAGGLTKPDNLWTLCMDCNRGKSAKEL